MRLARRPWWRRWLEDWWRRRDRWLWRPRRPRRRALKLRRPRRVVRRWQDSLTRREASQTWRRSGRRLEGRRCRRRWLQRAELIEHVEVDAVPCKRQHFLPWSVSLIFLSLRLSLRRQLLEISLFLSTALSALALEQAKVERQWRRWRRRTWRRRPSERAWYQRCVRRWRLIRVNTHRGQFSLVFLLFATSHAEELRLIRACLHGANVRERGVGS